MAPHCGKQFVIIGSQSFAKYGARRDKDRAFNRALAQRGIVTRARLLQLLEVTPVDEAIRRRIQVDIENDLRSP